MFQAATVARQLSCPVQRQLSWPVDTTRFTPVYSLMLSSDSFLPGSA
jgi:hypothetical protein